MTPGRFDATVVQRHLAALDEVLQVLRRHRGRPVVELQSSRESLWIVAHGLQLAAQNVLDLATHLAAGGGHDVPTYAAALDRLMEMGILPVEFVNRFREIAGFRNVIVHGYLNLDLRIVHRMLNERLDDFSEFAGHIQAYLTHASDA